MDDLGRAALRDAEQRAGAIRVGFFQMVAAAVLGGRAGKEHPPDAMAAKRGHQIGRALNVDVDVLLGGRRWIERGAGHVNDDFGSGLRHRGGDRLGIAQVGAQKPQVRGDRGQSARQVGRPDQGCHPVALGEAMIRQVRSHHARGTGQ